MFCQTMQNKVHWAITRKKRVAEIIAEQAHSSKPLLGLSEWKNAPAGKIQKPDVAVVQNRGFVVSDEDQPAELVRQRASNGKQVSDPVSTRFIIYRTWSLLCQTVTSIGGRHPSPMNDTFLRKERENASPERTS
ncbi:MAG: RhuM family protein [Planctomycetaceae bacterium]